MIPLSTEKFSLTFPRGKLTTPRHKVSICLLTKWLQGDICLWVKHLLSKPFAKDRWRRFLLSSFPWWNTVLRIRAVDWFALCWLHKADTLWKIIHQILLHEPLNMCWLDSLVMTHRIQNIFKLNSGYSTAATRVIYIFSACSKRKRQVPRSLKVTTSMKRFCFFLFTCWPRIKHG